MAIIQSGATADLLTIDPTSKAGRVTLYDSAGNEIHSPPNPGSYILPMNIRQTAATAAPATIFACKAGATRTMYIRRLALRMGFDGTAAAATTVRIGLQRFTVATPAGGTTVVAIKKRSTYAAANMAVAQFLDTGLTMTGAVFETDMMVFGLPISVTNGVAEFAQTLQTPVERFSPVELAPNEGLAIRLNVVSVVGQSLTGFIEFDER